LSLGPCIDGGSSLLAGTFILSPAFSTHFHSIYLSFFGVFTVASMSSPSKTLIYLFRHDLRTTDNPILQELARLQQQKQRPFTYLLPIYVFPADQVEVSGFLRDPADESPYPEARSYVGGFWRCGPHRAKFLGESVWDLKEQLEHLGSSLEIRAGLLADVLRDTLKQLKDQSIDAAGVWMTAEEGTEEKDQENEARKVAEGAGTELKLWTDEKYLVDE
jgi:deoxyribodipyrimidine photo-lyase